MANFSQKYLEDEAVPGMESLLSNASHSKRILMYRECERVAKIVKKKSKREKSVIKMSGEREFEEGKISYECVVCYRVYVSVPAMRGGVGGGRAREVNEKGGWEGGSLGRGGRREPKRERGG